MKLRIFKSWCLKWHEAYSVPKPANNVRAGRSFFVAIWCNRCKVVRHIEYWKCQSCGFFFKPAIYAEHVRDCKLIIESDPSVITAAMYHKASEPIEATITNLA